jgi:antitoxin component YwqK of YwqJK toxin-antitoxin module
MWFDPNNDNEPFTGIITQENKEEGFLFLGRVSDGKQEGDWIKWFPGGKDVPEIIIVNIPEPEDTLPWSGGKQEQGGYKDGKKHGQWTEWYDNEHVKSHGNYDNGIMNGQWTFFHKNGIKEKEGVLVDGNADGLWHFWDEDANKIQEVPKAICIAINQHTFFFFNPVFMKECPLTIHNSVIIISM